MINKKEIIMATKMKYKEEVGVKFCDVANKNGDKNYCTLHALSEVTNWNYNKCVRHMAKFAERRFRDGCHPEHAVKMAFHNAHGWCKDITDDVINKEGIKTIRTFEDTYQYCKDRKFYLITAGHACAFVHGKLRDWATNTCQRLEIVYEVNGYPNASLTKGYNTPSWAKRS